MIEDVNKIFSKIMLTIKFICKETLVFQKLGFPHTFCMTEKNLNSFIFHFPSTFFHDTLSDFHILVTNLYR